MVTVPVAVPPVTEVRFEPGALVVLVVMSAAYALGVRRAGGRGHPWPATRTASFGFGVLVLLVATSSGLSAVGRTNLVVHGVADILTVFVAPVFLVLGAPVELARRASSDPVRSRIDAVLAGRARRALTHPVVSWIPFAAALFVLYFTSLLATSVHSSTVAQLVSLGLVAAGVFLTWPLLSPDTPSVWLGPFAVMADILLLFLYFTVFGLAVESQGSTPVPGTSLSALHTAGGVIWTVGGLGSMLVVLYALALYLREEERHAPPRGTVDEVAAAQLATWRAQATARQTEERAAPRTPTRPSPVGRRPD